ncbi:flagellar filament capping protein FliD [Alicycliphilus denitrificans]|uniref:flagellar filament capping protein FliD n=1 Tax=Alicycliphilus denitrificans TaxID=179636 RepID=UPI00384C557D
MSTISSPGIGSGLDVNAIVSQMMKLEQRPLQLLQTKASGIETKISSYGQVKSAMAALYDAAKGLTNLDTWRGKQFASGDETILKGSASSSAQAAQFSLQVNHLAQSQSVATSSLPSGSGIGTSGTLTLERGKWSADQSGFAGAGSAIDITIDAGDKLTDIAKKINDTKDAGVSAVVIKDASGERLLLRSNTTGEENGFALSVSDPGLNILAHDPASVAADNGASRTQAAKDASFSINSVEARSASNTVEDIVPGVTLNLLKPSDKPIDITISDDTKAIKDKIEAFKDAYNKLNSTISGLTKYDQGSKKAQPLQGDNTVVGMLNSLRGLVGNPNSAGDYFSSLGLEVQRDGSLNINSTKLDAALKDLPKLEKALTDGTDGLVTRIREFAFKANGVEGNITSRTKALQDSLKRNESDQERINLLLDQRQKNMLKQYQSLDANMSTMNSLSSFMNNQIGQWNKS